MAAPSAPNPPDIVVLGNLVVDIIGKPLERLPAPGTLLLIDTLETHVGGNGPNTAGALGRLGARVALAGRVGEDLYGRFLLEHLERWGVETSLVRRDPQSVTSVTLVAVDRAGERSFIHHLGANGEFGPSDLDWERIGQAKHLHLASFFILPGLDGTPAEGVLRRAKRHGLTTSVDVCWDRENRWLPLLAPCLPFVDYLLPSEEEGARLTGCRDPRGMTAALLTAGCGAVAVKLGAGGCFYGDGSVELALPAYDVAVRETTGAGDCFIAGFLYGLLQGWGLEQRLRFANACGARAVQVVGGVTGMAPAAEIEAWAAAQRLRE